VKKIVMGVLAAVLVLAGLSSAEAAPRAHAVPPKATTSAPVTIPGGTTISGLDLHDGTIVESAGTYYLYGTQYGCGFRWGVATATNWCGYGVSSAPSLAGPWSAPTLLFSPTSVDPWNGRTWVDECTRASNAGCFNPRMVQRYDGVWILAFNSPADYAVEHANAYNFMGCEGPAGPCGPGSGPHGSYHKPSAYTCATNGDFTVFNSGATAYLVCTMPNQTLAEEQLDSNWTNGNISGHGLANLSGYTAAEGPGVYYDTANAKWIMTLSYKNCGYGSGCGTAYAWAYTPMGPWYNPGNYGFAVDSKARSTLSWNSCGGQPRTVFVDALDGQAYQLIDLWVPGAAGDSRNQTDAPVHLEPLVHRNQVNTPGQPWQPFDPWSCS
jgi:hypothetical protein